MKQITLLGFFTVLNLFCLSAKESNTILSKEAFITMSDTVDSNTIIIPNVFSPNGDRINDLFKASGAFTKLDVNIYNRYGELIYNSVQLNEGWNGRTTSGSQCPEGTYFYIIITDSETFKGSLTLFR
jgi:gliding motility-associated-like protein